MSRCINGDLLLTIVPRCVLDLLTVASFHRETIGWVWIQFHLDACIRFCISMFLNMLLYFPSASICFYIFYSFLYSFIIFYIFPYVSIRSKFHMFLYVSIVSYMFLDVYICFYSFVIHSYIFCMLPYVSILFYIVFYTVLFVLSIP